MRYRFVLITTLLVLSAGICAAAEDITYTFGSPAPPTPSPSFGTYVNFDVLPNGNPAPSNSVMNPTDYSSVGVTINSLDGNALYYTDGSSQSQPNYIAESGYGFDAQFVFSKPMQDVGLGIASDGTDDTYFSFYDAHGNLLGSFDDSNDSENSYIVFTDLSGGNISSMTASNAGGAFDDLQYAPTPEPSSIAFLATGLLGGLGAIRRKLAR